MANLRERLIKQSVHSKRTKRVPIELIEDDGSVTKAEVEIRTPTVAQANVISASEKEGHEKANEAVAQIIIQCCFDPESGKPIFQPTDVSFILDQSPNSWVGVLVREVTELTNEAQRNAKN